MEVKGYQEWFNKAEEDEFAGNEILDGERFPAPACFHFQQVAEKYLKGFLIFHSKPFAKVHDLLELETLLQNREPEIVELHSDLEKLNRYYVETRYPGDYPEFTIKDCEEARESAMRIKEFVLNKIKK